MTAARGGGYGGRGRTAEAARGERRGGRRGCVGPAAAARGPRAREAAAGRAWERSAANVTSHVLKFSYLFTKLIVIKFVRRCCPQAPAGSRPAPARRDLRPAAAALALGLSRKLEACCAMSSFSASLLCAAPGRTARRSGSRVAARRCVVSAATGGTVTLQHEGKTHTLAVASGDSILESALSKGVKVPYDCKARARPLRAHSWQLLRCQPSHAALPHRWACA
jgi:hypothetical protein